MGRRRTLIVMGPYPPTSLALAAVLCMATCFDGPSATTSGANGGGSANETWRATYSQEVPAEGPDSVPAFVYENGVRLENGHGDLVSTTILTVYFELQATRAEKQAAVDLVEGTVIGGSAGDTEGIYLVQVAGDSTLATIDALAGVLRDLPQVWQAFPHALIHLGY